MLTKKNRPGVLNRRLADVVHETESVEQSFAPNVLGGRQFLGMDALFDGCNKGLLCGVSLERV